MIESHRICLNDGIIIKILDIVQMVFGITRLLRLSLSNETVPTYEGVQGKIFPERLPAKLVGLCFVNSLVKLMIPLLLE